MDDYEDEIMFQKDLQHALRLLIRYPVFSSLAILSLALGIGANTAIFSIISAVLLGELPYHEPERLVAVWEANEELGWNRARVAAANFLDWRERSTHFESMAAYTPWSSGLTITGTGDPEHVEVGFVTGNYFSLLGVDAFIGRGFAPEETWQGGGGDVVVVVSHGFWQRRFGGAPGVIGRTFNLNQQKVTIIGVMPESFEHLPGDVDLWATFGWHPTETQGSVRLRRAHNLRAVGRLAKNVSLRQAEDELKSIARELEETYPETNRGMDVGVTPLREWLVGDTRLPLLILLGSVTLVLLIGCANLANLLLARTASRSRELSLRIALGAGRWAMVRHLMTESIVLSIIGGMVGLLVGFILTRFFLALDEEIIPRNFEVAIDHRVLLYTLGITLLTALLFGFVPALKSSRADPVEAIKEYGGKSSGSVKDRMSRDLLIISEVALAVLLVTGAGLLLRSLDKLLEVDVGFDSENLLTFQINLPRSRYQEKAAASFYDELTARLAGLPGAKASGASSLLPLTGQDWTGGFKIEGKDSDQIREETLRNSAITPGYFEAMGLSLLEGRFFNDGDREDAAKTVVINQVLAETYFSPGESPLGKRIRFNTDSRGKDEWWIIVGLVEDQRQETISSNPKPEVFRPHRQWVYTQMNVVVSTSIPPESMIKDVRQIVREIDQEIAIYDIQTMEDLVQRSLGNDRFITWLMFAFAMLALLQAGFGIYGVISYSVNQRFREFGIRITLGAHSSEVFLLVLKHGILVIGIGLAIGMIAALLFTKVLADQLYAVSHLDPATFVVVAIFLALVGIAASFLPARRATRINPAVSIRSE